MLDRTVLAGRVHRLKYEQHRTAILGVEHVLLFCEPLGAALKEVCRLSLIQPEVTGVARVEVLQTETVALGDAERVDVLLDAVKDFFSWHSTTSPSWNDDYIQLTENTNTRKPAT
jgi:hypothetical protein